MAARRTRTKPPLQILKPWCHSACRKRKWFSPTRTKTDFIPLKIEESQHYIIAKHVHPLQNMNRFQYGASRGRTSSDLWLERVKAIRAGFSRTLPPFKTSLKANCQYLKWRCIHLFRQLEIKKPLNASLHLTAAVAIIVPVHKVHTSPTVIK